MLRREKLGCLLVFFLPFFALATLLLWKAGQGLVQGLGRDALAELSRARSFEDLVVSQSLEGCGAFVLFLLGTLLVAGLPVLTIWFRMGRKPEPEPEALLVAPVPGAAPPKLSARSSLGPEPEPGRVGKTGLRIDEWQPGRRVGLSEKARTRIPFAMALIAGLVVLFVLIPSFEPGSFEIVRWKPGLPPLGHLLVDSWLLALVVLTLKPSPARAIEVDWQADAIALTRGGRLRRLLGLSRLRAIEHRQSDSGYVDAETMDTTPRDVRYRQQLVAWIAPEGREPVPYLVLESRPRRYDGAERDRATAAVLVERLAAALGVVTQPPAEVGAEEIYG